MQERQREYLPEKPLLPMLGLVGLIAVVGSLIAFMILVNVQSEAPITFGPGPMFNQSTPGGR